MLKNFFDKYLFLSVGDHIDGGGDFKINLFLLAITLGLCLAAFIVCYHKKYTYDVLRQLIRHNAINEDSAKTLTELRLHENKGLMRALCRRGQLTNMIKRVGAKNYSYEEFVALQKKKLPTEEKIDFTVAKFYIFEEQYDRAKRVYEREHPSYIRTVFSCVFLVAVFFILAFTMPMLLDFVDNMISK